MKNDKYKMAIVLLIGMAILAISATITPGSKFKNLKVLPKDISEQKLDSIMESYNKALNVSCDFCHTPPKDPFAITPQTGETDFSLDNNMKEEARSMIRMMNNINKTYFYFDTTIRHEYLNVVSCNTCHRGNPYPANE